MFSKLKIMSICLLYLFAGEFFCHHYNDILAMNNNRRIYANRNVANNNLVDGFEEIVNLTNSIGNYRAQQRQVVNQITTARENNPEQVPILEALQRNITALIANLEQRLLLYQELTGNNRR
ncbi:hypothetical protein [Candidatus Phytoplasma melaleucae]|uniref:Sequence-variable mosaic (SVM) signal sequence domain-containing protein n=1 Tax=Candidatus Phytoplasma melaleucae TaxID=2982630 RepID=A0ABT9DE01_9MOLU|nr:hypothetical protein ['Melaleuca sp.' phytoplasma]MDO8168239.1 hypothetical protein ['Melaleuca sp.' phytoplasma]